MITGQCLCGAHRFELEPPFELNHHCHCGFCRKHHGAGFVSLVGVPEDRLTWHRGETIRYESSPGLVRESCATCGAAMPQKIEGLPMFVPAGFLDDLDAHFDFRIFAAHKADWDVFGDAVPAFDEYPPGVESEAQASIAPRDPAGGTRGSCLCGAVRWVAEGEGATARHCHCSRCRKGRAAERASNWMVPAGDFRFTSGEDAIRRYKLPEAEFFTQCFCERCGGKVPNLDRERGIAVVPLGGLDDPAPMAPVEHIFVADQPAWSRIEDDLPRHDERGSA